MLPLCFQLLSPLPRQGIFPPLSSAFACGSASLRVGKGALTNLILRLRLEFTKCSQPTKQMPELRRLHAAFLPLYR